MASKDQITIYFDDSITDELKGWLKENGATPGGRKLLRMGYLLENSGLADQIMLLAGQKRMADATQFELVEMAVELLKPLQESMTPVSAPAAVQQEQVQKQPVTSQPEKDDTGDVLQSAFGKGRVQQ